MAAHAEVSAQQDDREGAELVRALLALRDGQAAEQIPKAAELTVGG